MENVVDEQTQKKVRHRKKQLFNSILQLMEFYFSDSNLSKDRFLTQLLQTDPFVDVSVFLRFNKIRKLTSSVEDVVKAIGKSETLELSEDKTKVKRTTPVRVKENVDECTVYVENVKTDATHEWLSSIFSEFGNVVYVSLPKYKHNRINKGFAFVEFERDVDAKRALEYFESVGCKMSSQMCPEDLCSIATYEGDGSGGGRVGFGENDENSVEDKASKKRKRTDEDEESKKKSKSNNTNKDEVGVENNAEDDAEEKKKRKSKKIKKKVNPKELGLQVLSKQEWKKMRNRYLDTQKKKMKQLKQFLNKQRFNNRLEDYKQKTFMDTEESENAQQNNNGIPKLVFMAGVIVKVELPEPCTEVKKIKSEIKTYSGEIKYIDFPLPEGSSEVYIRFSDSESARKFCTSGYNGKCALLADEEEKSYWEKIQNDRSAKFKKENKKQRGRNKLLKKAEKELGKHIRFDDSD